MKPAFDLTSVRKTLQHGIDQGYWTLEDLDRSPKGHLNPDNYCNLLRDHNLEAVEISSPRDYTPVAAPAGTPANSVPAGPAQVPLDAHRPAHGLLDHHGDEHQDARADGADQSDQGRSDGLGQDWDVPTQLHGAAPAGLPDDW